jgi:hypothetical protein
MLFADPERMTLMCPGPLDEEALGHWTCTVERFTQALAGRLEDT